MHLGSDKGVVPGGRPTALGAAGGLLSRVGCNALFALSIILAGILASACAAPGHAIRHGTTATPIPVVPTVVPAAELDVIPLPMPAFVPTGCRFRHDPTYQVDCGDLIVPEVRSEPGGPAIHIHVAIFRSTHPKPLPDPVVYLGADLGANQLDAHAAVLRGGGDEILQHRDLILLNRRGTRHNRPELDCRQTLRGLSMLPTWPGQSREPGSAQLISGLLACHEELAARGINLDAYNTVEAAADVNDLRIALGYDQINLVGSFAGSRTALTMLRYHPEGIRSAILESVLPPEVDPHHERAPNAHSALGRLFSDCAADPHCCQAYPDLETVFYATIDALNRKPVPLWLEQGATAFSGDRLMDLVYLHIWEGKDTARLPMWIDRASKGDLSPIEEAMNSQVAWADGTRDGSSGVVAAATICHEELPFESYGEAVTLSSGLPRPLKEYFVPRLPFDLCEQWPSGQSDAVENTPVVSHVPALVLAGEYDPLSVPAWGQMVAANLSNSYYYEFPGFGHAVMAASECGLSIALQFLDDPAAEPEAACLDQFGAPSFE
jgi:pimeloyl-ACP methyl ester carboxylesterase